MSGLSNRVQSFWHKGELSLWERLCLSSFARRGYDVELYTYEDTLAVPDGVVPRDAAEIVPESEVFYYQAEGVKGRISAFTNLFRYVLLYERGGWWIDTDVVCLSGLPRPDGFLAGFEEDGIVNGAVLFSEPGGRIMRDAMRACRTLGKNVQWGEGGPRLLSALLRADGLRHSLAPVHMFYPIHWSEVVRMLLLPEHAAEAAGRCARSSTLHLYNEMLGRAGVRKSLLPPQGSFLHGVFAGCGAVSCDGPAMAADDVRARLATEDR